MTEKRITIATDDEQIKQLYETAFPEDEQIPWKDLMRLIGEMPLDFTAYYDGQTFIGFTIVYPRKSFNWFWYFAVREELFGILCGDVRVCPDYGISHTCTLFVPRDPEVPR